MHEYWWILSQAVYHIVRACELQYDTPRGTIFTNIHAITLLYSNTYFFFRSVINTVKIWFFHISLLYCTRKNILICALVQYEFCFISWGSTSFHLFKRKAMSSSDILTFQFCFISWGSTSSPLFKRKAMSSSAILTFQTTGESNIWEMTFGTHRYRDQE